MDAEEWVLGDAMSLESEDKFEIIITNLDVDAYTMLKIKDFMFHVGE